MAVAPPNPTRSQSGRSRPMRRRRCPWAGVDARERGLARRYTARANPYHDDRCAISRGTIEPIQHRPKCHQKHCAPEAATIFEGTKAHRRARHVDRYHRGGRVESRVAERLGNACREARPQPDRDSGWISRLHRPGGIPTATSSSTTSASADGTPSFDGKPANTWSWTPAASTEPMSTAHRWNRWNRWC